MIIFATYIDMIYNQKNDIMTTGNYIWKWVCFLFLTATVQSCGVDIPKETLSSFETMTVQKADIETPVKFSAKMKGQLNEAVNIYNGAQGIIALYIALGGDTH